LNPVSSGIPTEAKFQISLLFRVGGWGEIEIKAKLSPDKAGAWAELGKKKYSVSGFTIEWVSIL
jgi:hypothetical protein